MMQTDEWTPIFRWQDPSSMYAWVKTRAPRGSRLFSNAGSKIREAWTMSLFGIGYELLERCSVGVRMVAEADSPWDAQSRFDGNVVNFQIKECLERETDGTSRRRHDEYRKVEQRGGVHVEELQAVSKEVALSWIAEAVSNAGNKRSCSQTPPHLLVYVNFDHARLDIRNVADRVSKLSIRYFSAVWLMGTCWSVPKSDEYLADGHFVGCVFPAPRGFLKFNALSRRIIPQQELLEEGE